MIPKYMKLTSEKHELKKYKAITLCQMIYTIQKHILVNFTQI